MTIVLEKSGDKHRINLEKGGKPITGEIKINLDWSKGGFFKQMFGSAIDLDLGCFYELRDGKKMLIDGLQFSHGRGEAEISRHVKDAIHNLHIFGIKVMTEEVLLNQERQSLLILLVHQISSALLSTRLYMKV